MEENEIIEENDQPTTKSLAMKWGLINGIIGIVIFILIDLAGLVGNQLVGWIGYVVFAVLVVLAHKEFKSEGDGFMSYGQGLGIGTLTMVISSVISSAFFFIYVSFVSTSFIDTIKENQIMSMQEQGMSDAEIDQAMGFSEFFMSPVAMTLIGLITAIFIGFIISLLVTIFTKNPDPEFS